MEISVDLLNRINRAGCCQRPVATPVTSPLIGDVTQYLGVTHFTDIIVADYRLKAEGYLGKFILT